MKKKKRILIVEDDNPSALLLKQMLSKYGYLIIDTIDTGERAIEVAEKEKPDIILMDITLKGDQDGIETSRIIYEKFGIASIYLTVSTDDETLSRAKTTVHYGYILKPYDKNMIRVTVDMALHKVEVETRIREIEKRNHDILESIPDTVFYVKEDGTFATEIEEKVAREMWPSKVSQKAVPVVKDVLKKGEIGVFDYILKRGEILRNFEARIINNDNNTALVIVRDVTKAKKAESDLQNYQKNLEIQVAKRTHELTQTNRDLETQIALRKKMEQSLKIFSHAIEQSPNIEVIIDENGMVEYVNMSFCNISGFECDFVIGTNVNEHGNPVISEPEIWKSMTGSKKWKGEMYNLNKKGELYYLNASVTAIEGEDDNIVHFIISAEDITEAKREKMALDKVKDVLEKTSNEMANSEMDWKEWKEKMMERNISRTDKSLFKNIHNSFTQGAGFGALISLLDMLSSTSKKQEDKHLVDSSVFSLIIDNVNMVKEAFKTFTSIDWIISNEFDLKKMALPDFYDSIKVIINKAAEFAVFHNNKIIINDFNAHHKALSVKLNAEYFSKALYEILLNAMKFSKMNSYVTVFFNVTGKEVTVSVINDPEKTDEGITGIPIEYEKVVFEPFYRLSKSVFERFQTLDFGLGLTLVEKITNKHGGEVSAKNILDHTDTRREAQVKVNVTLSLPLSD